MELFSAPARPRTATARQVKSLRPAVLTHWWLPRQPGATLVAWRVARYRYIASGYDRLQRAIGPASRVTRNAHRPGDITVVQVFQIPVQTTLMPNSPCWPSGGSGIGDGSKYLRTGARRSPPDTSATGQFTAAAGCIERLSLCCANQRFRRRTQRLHATGSEDARLVIKLPDLVVPPQTNPYWGVQLREQTGGTASQ